MHSRAVILFVADFLTRQTHSRLRITIVYQPPISPPSQIQASNRDGTTHPFPAVEGGEITFRRLSHNRALALLLLANLAARDTFSGARATLARALEVFEALAGFGEVLGC